MLVPDRIDHPAQGLQVGAEPARRHPGLVDVLRPRVGGLESQGRVVRQQATQAVRDAGPHHVAHAGPFRELRRPRRRLRRLGTQRLGELGAVARSCARRRERGGDGTHRRRVARPGRALGELELQLAEAQPVVGAAGNGDEVVVELADAVPGRFVEHHAPTGRVELEHLLQLGVAHHSQHHRRHLRRHGSAPAGPRHLGARQRHTAGVVGELQRPHSALGALALSMPQRDPLPPEPQVGRVEVRRPQR